MEAGTEGKGPAAAGDRDSSLSSLHGIGKLLHARLDRRGRLPETGEADCDWAMATTELPLDIVLSFLQGNCILTIAHSSACLAYQTGRGILPAKEAKRRKKTRPDSSYRNGSSDPQREDSEIFRRWRDVAETSGLEVGGLVDAFAVEQICATLTYLSDCDALLARKYDSSFLMDRGNDYGSSSGINSAAGAGGIGSVFPEGYVSALCARAIAVGKGVGYRELWDRAQQGGFRGSFEAILRPKSLDMRSPITNSLINIIFLSIVFLIDELLSGRRG